MIWTIAMPLIVPLATACACLWLWTMPRAQVAISLLGCAGLAWASISLAIAVDQHEFIVLHVGGWRAPFGIALVADRFSSLLVCLTALAGLAATLYASLETHDALSRRFVMPLIQLLLFGVCGAFLTGDLFNLYVWFEVLLMASFVLLVLDGERPALTVALKYVVPNLLASILFLTAAGVLYGLAGTLNMADLARVLMATGPRPEISAAAGLLLVAFAIKAALFPVFFWMPASYHTPSFAASALFAALLSKVGMYSIFRVCTLIFEADTQHWRGSLAVIAALSMVVGVLGAASQYNVRRILAFHSVSQMGYILMGLVIGTPAGLAAGVFFFLHHGLVKSNLFLAAGAMHGATQGRSLTEERLSGLLRRSPILATAFLVTALSLAGVPPMSGFAAKLGLIVSGIDREMYWLVTVATAVGLLTTFSMLKIWAEAFWRERETPPPIEPLPDRNLPGMIAVPLALAALTLALGVLAGPVLRWCERAGVQLSTPSLYIRAVEPARFEPSPVLIEEAAP